MEKEREKKKRKRKQDSLCCLVPKITKIFKKKNDILNIKLKNFFQTPFTLLP